MKLQMLVCALILGLVLIAIPVASGACDGTCCSKGASSCAPKMNCGARGDVSTIPAASPVLHVYWQILQSSPAIHSNFEAEIGIRRGDIETFLSGQPLFLRLQTLLI